MSNPIFAGTPRPLDELYAARLRNEIRLLDADASRTTEPQPEPQVTPLTNDDRSKNPLRPTTLDEVIGQERAKRMMARVIEATRTSGEPMDHTLLVGAAGTGKTTFANVVANELHAPCYQISAPVSLETLLNLREQMNDGDILFVDEIHMQAVQERRGKTASTEPEVFLQLLEDQVIATESGMLPYPNITVIGATTDEGMLPDPFIARFPLRPRLDPYTDADLTTMARMNATKLLLDIEGDAAAMFARAARGTPRIINNYVKNARVLVGPDRLITEAIADEVLDVMNGTTRDGLTPDQQAMLTFLYEHGRRETKDGEVRYQASVGTIATGIGKSRDTKAIQLRVESHLIASGFVQVSHGGRTLTDAGITRAQELLASRSTTNGG